jgi:hypothetical protein
MPRFHFNLHVEAGREFTDLQAHDFPSLASAELAAVGLAAQIANEDCDGAHHRWIEIIDHKQMPQALISLRSILLLKPE